MSRADPHLWQLRHITDFYEVPSERLAELRKAAGGSRTRLSEMLASLNRPVPPIEEPEPYMGALVAYLDQLAILENQWSDHQSLLTDLVEFHGDGWDLIEARTGLAEMLDPSLFNETRLRRFWEDGEEDRPEVGALLLADLPLLRRAIEAVTENGYLLLHDH
jgi:hypothetical protein